MYAIYWTDEKGNSGNGEHCLTHSCAQDWLVHLQKTYPTMKHWITNSSPSRIDESQEPPPAKLASNQRAQPTLVPCNTPN